MSIWRAGQVARGYQGCLCVFLLLQLSPWSQPDQKPLESAEPRSDHQSTKYQIELELDYAGARFTGRETVRFFNRTRREIDELNFYLYPNAGLQPGAEHGLTVKTVTSGSQPLPFSYRAGGTRLNVSLLSKLQPASEKVLTIEFSARVPEIQREETSLLAHFLDEVQDAMSSERPVRDSRDIFFTSDRAMLLGYFYPLLAPPSSSPLEQSLAAGVSNFITTEVADYEVLVRTDTDLTVVASGEAIKANVASPGAARPRPEYAFRGRNLRGFALALSDRLKSNERRVGGTRLRSYFRVGEESIGNRVLEISARALEIYNQAFGKYPDPALSVVELPLPASYSGVSFPGLVVLAQAYYIDFDAPQADRLPAIVRENADLVKGALEFTLAHEIAHQWWGAIVGSDSQQHPYLDEALANYSAVYYYEGTGGAAAAEAVLEQQIRGTYQTYRAFGGTDLEIDKPARDFRNALQYAAIVQAKGAMFIHGLRKLLGDQPFFGSLANYYATYRFRIATPEDFRQAFVSAATDQRAVQNLFRRYLKEKHGDEDLGKPDLVLFSSEGSKMRTLGRIFVRIGRRAARPF